MPLVAAAAGWHPGEMQTSDVSLFSSIVGTMLAGNDLAELGVRLDGEPVALPDADLPGQAAHLLWLQLLARMQAKPDADYWRQLVADLEGRADEHRAAIRERLLNMSRRLGGLRYRSCDIWTHIDTVADDPHTVISLNMPTYKSGFERFFDTKGRLTWNEPAYDVIDPDRDHVRLTELMAGRKALLLSQQQVPPGCSAHPTPVFARHLSLGQYVYLNSNRPDEVFAITGGPKVAPRRPGDLAPGDLPILAPDAQITADSRVDLIPVKAAVADYYRGLWMHRLAAAPGSDNLLVAVDGQAAGVIGYNSDTLVRPYSDRWERHLILRFAFGAPHDTLRLTRLVTMLALQKRTAEATMTGQSAFYLAASVGVITVETTRHPEIKGLRGLMKLGSRDDHPDGYKLVYHARWSNKDNADVLADWLAKEERWRKSVSR